MPTLVHIGTFIPIMETAIWRYRILRVQKGDEGIAFPSCIWGFCMTWGVSKLESLSPPTLQPKTNPFVFQLNPHKP